MVNCRIRGVKVIVAVAMLCALSAGTAVAGVEAGLDAAKRGDYVTAIAAWIPAAKRGNLAAQSNLAVAYIRLGDRKAALPWLHKAAEQGDMESQHALGAMYGTGSYGGPPDHGRALKWLHMAAAQGNSEARLDIGFRHFFGIGVKRNDAEARKWFGQAAKQNHPRAQHALGDMYRMGRGGPKGLGEALELYEKAARGGYSESHYLLGVAYMTGRFGVKRDDRVAVRHFRNAAERGHPEAQLGLALMLIKSVNGIRDPVEAYAWAAIAVESGATRAELLLLDIRSDLTPDELQDADRRAGELRQASRRPRNSGSAQGRRNNPRR